MPPTNEPTPMLRKIPRQHETISIHGRTKWRLDALCLLGRRSRSATIEIMLDAYLQGKPKLRAAIEERESDPHPIQLKRTGIGNVAGAVARNTSAEDFESPAEAGKEMTEP